MVDDITRKRKRFTKDSGIHGIALHKQSMSVNIPAATRELFSKARQNLNEWRKKRGQNGITGWQEYFNAVAVSFSESRTYYCKAKSASDDQCGKFFSTVAESLGCNDEASDLRNLKLSLNETDIETFVEWINVEDPTPASYRYPVKMRTLTKQFFMRQQVRELWMGCKDLDKRRLRAHHCIWLHVVAFDNAMFGRCGVTKNDSNGIFGKRKAKSRKSNGKKKKEKEKVEAKERDMGNAGGEETGGTEKEEEDESFTGSVSVEVAGKEAEVEQALGEGARDHEDSVENMPKRTEEPKPSEYFGGERSVGRTE